MKSSYCTLYLIRHGETEWNVKRLVQGHTDSKLTKNGIAQARKLAKKFKNIKIDAIFSSDLTRAKRTAEIVALEKKLAVKTSELLRERRFGKYEGKRFDVLNLLNRLENLSEKNADPELANEVENYESLIGRFITFLREVSTAFLGKNILIVTHGGCLKIFLIHLGLTTYENMGPDTLENGAIVKVKSDGIDFFVEKTIGIKGIDKRFSSPSR